VSTEAPPQRWAPDDPRLVRMRQRVQYAQDLADAGATQGEIAEEIGVSRFAVVKWVQRGLVNPPLEGWPTGGRRLEPLSEERIQAIRSEVEPWARRLALAALIHLFVHPDESWDVGDGAGSRTTSS
jgi:hypothetical protein